MEAIMNKVLIGIGLSLLLILLVYVVLILILRRIEKSEDEKYNNSL